MGVNPSKSKGHDQPVEMASWNAVQEFCKKAGEKTGLAIRLPTGAEWEHACRAGTTTRFCSGDTKADLEKVAWCDKKGGDKPQPVGKKAPNAWGLYDMHGNIGEWVADNHVDYGAEAVIDPQAPHTDDGRIIRGGAFYATDLPCSSFMIGTWKAGLGDSGTGFRVAADVPPKAP
jgi:formylglycine-generating enzyme required for sulfatase activity